MIHSEIRCDGCGIVGPSKGQAYARWRGHVARDELRTSGWRVGEPHGKDYCPKCVAEDAGDCGWMGRQGSMTEKEIQLSENRLTAEKVNRKHEEQSAVALDARERVESA